MPEMNKNFTLKVTPEQFIAACTEVELAELDLLIGKEQQRRKRQTERRPAGFTDRSTGQADARQSDIPTVPNTEAQIENLVDGLGEYHRGDPQQLKQILKEALLGGNPLGGNPLGKQTGDDQ